MEVEHWHIGTKTPAPNFKQVLDLELSRLNLKQRPAFSIFTVIKTACLSIALSLNDYGQVTELV